jgi:hypothetical protein
MERHLSTGTVTIVALMAAHRLAQDQSHGSHTLDDFFRQRVARIREADRNLGEPIHCQSPNNRSCKPRPDRPFAK